jgi:uncharacterized protein (TIGR03067 family)
MSRQPARPAACRFEAMRLLRHILSIVCIAAAFIANAAEPLTAKAEGAANPPIAAELKLLQGTWEGGEVGDKGTSKNPDSQETSGRKPDVIDLDVLKTGVLESPPLSHGKIIIKITGDSFHFHRDTNFWFETAITLPAGTDPKQLHATIKDSPPSQASSIGQVVRAIFKIEDGTLTLATGGGEEAPTSFEVTGNNGLTRYELRKVQAQKKDAQPPKTK